MMLLDGMPPGLVPYGVSVSNDINFHDCYFYAASCPSGRFLINLKKKDKKMKKGEISRRHCGSRRCRRPHVGCHRRLSAMARRGHQGGVARCPHCLLPRSPGCAREDAGDGL